MMQKQLDTRHVQKTKSLVVNKTGKVEVHITDNQSWNSCPTVASDHELTFGSAIQPTKKKHNALLTVYYTWPLTSAKHGASGICMHCVCDIIKTTGHKTTRTGPDGVWNN